MNIKLLRRVQDKIRAHPKHFDMGGFFSNPGRPVEHYLIHACGTTACIAGWCILLSPKRLNFRTRAQRMQPIVDLAFSTDHAAGTARQLLDIQPEQSISLFYITFWPEPYHSEYLAADDPLRSADIAASRIEHFIKTKGQE